MSPDGPWDGFDLYVCEGGTEYAQVVSLWDVHPTQPFDALAFRVCNHDDSICRDVGGVRPPCVGASDAELAGCMYDWRSTPDMVGWRHPPPHEPFGHEHHFPPTLQVVDRFMIVYSRGATVLRLTNSDELRAFLGEIDSASEAALLMLLSSDGWVWYPYHLTCLTTHGRRVEEGYEFAARQVEYRRTPRLVESIVRVSSSGVITLMETRDTEYGLPVPP